MDIIFQSGEFNYQSSSVNAWLIELFRALVTVSMFFVGFYWNSWKEKKKQLKKLSELKEYFTQLTMYYLQLLENYNSNVIKFVENLKEDKSQHFIFDELNEDYYKNIDKIDPSELYKAYVTESKGESLEKISDYIGIKNGLIYLNNLINNLPMSANKFIEDHDYWHKQWNDNIEVVSNFNTQSTFLAGKETLKNDPFLQKYSECLESHYAKNIENPNDPYILLHSVVEPLIKLSENNIHDGRCSNLLPYLKRCKDSIIEMKDKRVLYSKYIEETYENINTTISSVRETLKRLNNRK